LPPMPGDLHRPLQRLGHPRHKASSITTQR
jgi:hypothetical protein